MFGVPLPGAPGIEALTDLFVRLPLSKLSLSRPDTSPLAPPRDVPHSDSWRDGLLPTCHLLASCVVLTRRYPAFLPVVCPDDPQSFFVRTFDHLKSGEVWPRYHRMPARSRRALGVLRLEPAGPYRALSAVCRAYEQQFSRAVMRRQDAACTLGWLTGCEAESYACSERIDAQAWLEQIVTSHRAGEAVVLSSRAQHAYAVLEVEDDRVCVLQTRARCPGVAMWVDAARLGSDFSGMSVTFGLADADARWNPRSGQ